MPTATPRLRATRRRLATAAGAYAVVVGLLGREAHHSAPTSASHASPSVAIGAMVPLVGGVALGALCAYVWRRRRRRWLVAGAALAVGMLVEAEALARGGALPGGALAAWLLAALLASELVRRWVRRRPGGAASLSVALALDHPLVGLVALLTPVLWLAAGGGGPAVLLPELVLIGAAGAALIAGVVAGRPGAAATPAWSTALAALWFVVATLPVWRGGRHGLLAGALGVGVLGGAQQLALRRASRDRRTEHRALRHALPLIAVHLGWPLADLLATLGAVGRGEATLTWRVALDPRLGAGVVLAAIASSLVVGYAAAALRGRREEPEALATRRLRPWLGAGALACEGAQGLAAGASPWRLVLAVAAMRTGIALYHLQLAHVRALRRAGLGVTEVAGAGVRAPTPGYIRRSWQPITTSCSTRAPSSVRSSAWPTRSSS